MDKADLDRLLAEIVGDHRTQAWPSYTRAYYGWKWKTIAFEETLREFSERRGPARFLDVGCGDAKDLFTLAGKLGARSDIEFVGTDLVPACLRFADHRVKTEGATRLRFIEADVQRLPFEADSFDLAWCQDVVEHLPAPDLCIKELFRVLRPGGSAVITTPNGANRLVRWIHRLTGRREAGPEAGPSPAAGPRDAAPALGGEPTSFGHISVRPWRAWVKAAQDAGFEVCRVRRGALVLGGPREDLHPVLFAGLLILDWVLDRLPGTVGLCEHFAMVVRKPQSSPR